MAKETYYVAKETYGCATCVSAAAVPEKTLSIRVCIFDREHVLQNTFYRQHNLQTTQSTENIFYREHIL